MLELLTVMAVITMMITLVAPAVSSLTKGGTTNSTLAELAGTLSQARQYAVAQNTYVWVALTPNLDDPADPSVSVVALASKSGQDPAPWSNYGAAPNAEITLLAKPRTFRQCRLEEAGAFDSSRISGLPPSPSVSQANSLSKDSAKFQVSSSGSPREYARVVQFRPDGQARTASGPIDVVEFGVRPMRGTTPDENNIAVLRINGLTGQTTVYRP